VTAPAAGPDPASLEIIHAELDRRQAACDTRWNAIDTKAGLLLAAAGVLIGFNADKPAVLTLLAELAACGAGAAAIRSMFPRKGREIDPRVLFDDFYTKPEAETRPELIRGRLVVLAEDQQAIATKSCWFKTAAALLAASGLFFVAHTGVGLMSSDPADGQRGSDEPATTQQVTISPVPAPAETATTLSAGSASMTASPAGSGPPGGATSGRPTDPGGSTP